MLGCGAVARALLELFALENVEIAKLIIVEPRDIPAWIKCTKHIKVALTPDNVSKILNPLINKDTYVIDLTVNVDAIPIMQICKTKQAKYMNTSLAGIMG